METSGWIQFAIYLIALALVTKPMGLYLMRVLDPNGKTWLDPVLAPVERFTYRAMGVDPRKEHDWKQYTLAMLLFSLVGCLFTYAILRLQYFLPLNPQKLAGVSSDLSFNTATSFTTNTNWQNYAGESTMSYFSQMVGLAFHNFVSAATGIAIAAALVRAIARHSATTLGNFWVDLVRVTYYLLLPICLVFAVFLVSQGMIQNFKPYTKATLVERMKIQVEKKNDKGETIKGPDGKAITEEQIVTDQNIVQGPMASQVAIKMLGTNGGGYVNANAAHPFENPTPLSNFVQMLSIFSIGSGLTYYLGRMVKNQKHGWTVWAAMLILFVGGVLLCWWAEANGNPIHQSLGVAGGNMEGKEVRFGIFNSALFATVTTDASCGAVNSMHDSFTALGGFVPLFNIQLGEVIFGGVGAGLYGMLVFVVLAVFIAGLMVGRTPEYLGKKIEAYDVKMAMLSLLILAISILGFAAWAVVAKWGLAGLNNNGPHGLSEILYAFSSGAGNNGSAFAGLSGNTPPYNTTLGFDMLFGRFLMIVPIMALAGSLVRKKVAPLSVGTFPVSGGTFLILLLGTVLLIGALNFLPALTLGPIVEHFLMQDGKLFLTPAPAVMTQNPASLFDWNIAGPAIGDAFKKLNPRLMVKNPVMFVTMVGAALTTVGIFTAESGLRGFVTQLAIWLWFTVLFANFAEAVAEGRGKAQAASLRRARKDTIARRLRNGREEQVPAPALQKGDLVVCEAGDIIPADGDVVEGIASVDEAAITGESAPVIRESGGDRSAVTGGTRVLSDRIVVRVTADKGAGFLDKMIALVEGARRQKTPNEIALTILLAALTFIFLLVCVTLKPFGIYSATNFSIPVLIALLVCLIPTTIGGLLSAIGIAGMDRVLQRNVLAMSGRAVEAAGDVDVLLLDKTGTITLGNRMAVGFHPAPGVSPNDLAASAQLSSLADETPEGRSIVVLAKEKFGLRARDMHELEATFVPFTAQTRMSGVDLHANGAEPKMRIRKGAADAVRGFIESAGGIFPQPVTKTVDEISHRGGTPLVVASDMLTLGTIELKDVVKGGIKERFAQLRKMGIKTVMITGDNPLTAAAIAAEAGVDDFMAQATPEQKLKRIRQEQFEGHLVAMTGDGTNDAPALAQADVGVAMNTGTQAAREAGNMVDLDSNPTKLLDIVEIGKQMLITRGSLTTFSIANDVAKYFAIVPAMLMTTFPDIAPLNIMHLSTSTSAILSAVIFNALIIIALIPLALRGVAYKPMGALAVLQRNLLIYGFGGLIVPFIGIKLVDLIITALHLA